MEIWAATLLQELISLRLPLNRPRDIYLAVPIRFATLAAQPSLQLFEILWSSGRGEVLKRIRIKFGGFGPRARSACVHLPAI